MAKGSINARIQCTIEVPVGAWSGGMTDIDKLAETVRREGCHLVEKMVADKQGKLIGTPKVLFMVMHEE